MTTENIRSSVRELVFGDSTNTAYSDTDLDRNVEQGQYIALGWAIEANSDWQVNGEVTTTATVAGQREYIFPSDLMKINAIRARKDANSEYETATKIDSRTIDDLDNYTPTRPEFDLLEDSLFLYMPQDIEDVEEGIEIDYQTNEALILPEVFTRISIFYATYIYALANELYSKASKFEKLLGLDQPMVDAGLKKELKTYYSRRATTNKLSLDMRRENNE